MRIGIVIPITGGFHTYSVNCLRSLIGSSTNRHVLEVFLILNAPDEVSRHVMYLVSDWVASNGTVRACSVGHRSTKAGISDVWNWGIRHFMDGGFSHVLVVNDDVVFPPSGGMDWAARLLAASEKGYAAVSPGWWERQVGQAERFEVEAIEKASKDLVEDGSLWGHSFLVNIPVCQELGLFTEQLGTTFPSLGLFDEKSYPHANWEDVDFVLRVLRAGGKVGVDNGTFFSHPVSGSTLCKDPANAGHYLEGYMAFCSKFGLPMVPRERIRVNASRYLYLLDDGSTWVLVS